MAMPEFEIVADRGAATEAPENTIAAFEAAAEQGADAVELDVRLTSDHVPVVHHFYNLGSRASASGPIFAFTWEQLRQVRLGGADDASVPPEHIPSLDEVLTRFGGRLGLEIHMQGPEPEAPVIVGGLLQQHRHIWGAVEVTSYEPAVLLEIQRVCPGLATDLLFPRSESWKTPDIEQYEAVQCGRMARATAVHIHPSQLSAAMVRAVRAQGIEVHAWDVNDENALGLVAELGIPRLNTDNLRQALAFRARFTQARRGAGISGVGD
jgi:glycerophosphoryl diester phosphodiesterase